MVESSHSHHTPQRCPCYFVQFFTRRRCDQLCDSHGRRRRDVALHRVFLQVRDLLCQAFRWLMPSIHRIKCVSVSIILDL